MSIVMKPLSSLIGRLKRDERGIAAVEFAIIAPILIVMIVGVMETGRVLYTKASLQSGLEMAGRYAMVHPNATSSTLEDIAYGDLSIKSSGGASPNITITNSAGGGKSFLILSASIDHKFLIPMVDLDPMSLTAQTVVPVDS